MPRIYGTIDFNNNALTGVATAAPGSRGTQAANTAFVAAAVAGAGGGGVLPLLLEQTAVTSTATTSLTATLIDATDFLWDGGFVASGKAVYLEILASATTGSPTVILTPLGSLIATATLTGKVSATTVRTRSSALTSLVSGTEYQVRLYNSSAAGIASLKGVRIIIL